MISKLLDFGDVLRAKGSFLILICKKEKDKKRVISPRARRARGLRYRKWPFAFGRAGTHMGGVCGGVCLSVCLLRGELVRAALTNRREIFGGGQGPCQERLSPEPARSVKVRAEKGREI